MDESYNFKTILSGATKFIEKFAKVLEVCHKWYQDNEETISMYLLAFADFGVWCVATNKLATKEIVFTDNLTSEFANEIYNSSDVDDLIQKYYFDNAEEKMQGLIERCKESKLIENYEELYFQILEAYKRAYYHLACVGLFSIIDGVLADTSNMINSTSFKKRIEVIESKFSDKIELNDIDRKTLCIYNSVNSLKDSIFGDSRFSENEPETINRHWIVHGRTRKDYTKYDFLKILLWLDAIIFLSKLSEIKENNND